jgi:hypothetical protein
MQEDSEAAKAQEPDDARCDVLSTDPDVGIDGSQGRAPQPVAGGPFLWAGPEWLETRGTRVSGWMIEVAPFCEVEVFGLDGGISTEVALR